MIAVADVMKEDSKKAIMQLQNMGIRVVMLTGDNARTAAAIGEKSGVDEVISDVLPEGKEEVIRRLSGAGKVAMVGDGINDAPALKRSDVGIAMGGVGSHSAIEAASVVIMDDDIGKLPLSVKMARRTETIVKENIIFSLSVKAIVFILASFGLSDMWLAVIADTGVSLIAVANSLRALMYKEK